MNRCPCCGSVVSALVGLIDGGWGCANCSGQQRPRIPNPVMWGDQAYWDARRIELKQIRSASEQAEDEKQAQLRQDFEKWMKRNNKIWSARTKYG